MAGRTPFQVLGVDRSARVEVIHAAYRALAKVYHPDMGSEPDPKEMVRINEAYETLKNDIDRRLWYEVTRPVPRQRLMHGKHFGKMLIDVPIDYLRWIVREKAFTPAIQDEAQELLRQHEAEEPEPVRVRVRVRT